MDLEIEIRQCCTSPQMELQPSGRLRLTFHWQDEIRHVLELVSHPLRDKHSEEFVELWAADGVERSFEQIDADAVVIRRRKPCH